MEHSAPSPFGQNRTAVHSRRSFNGMFVAAWAGILVGWFALNTLTTRIGAMKMGFHFYEVAALVQDPTRLLTGLNTESTLLTVAFSLVCLLTLAVAAPNFRGGRIFRYGPCAPLVLMLVCATILNHKTNENSVAVQNASEFTHTLINIANLTVRKSSQIMARYISIGAGAWLSGIAASYLAYTALRRHEPG